MKKILSVIETELKQAFAACGYEESYGKAVLSNRPDLWEYQCNGAMAAGHAYKKKPIDLASQGVEKLPEKHLFSMCEAGKPELLNIKI